MKIIPVLTEKSTNLAKSKKYAFWVPVGKDKFEIKREIEKAFTVHVTAIRTLNLKGGKSKNFRGIEKTVKDRKKAIVSLKADEKIDLFEEKKGK